MSEIENSPKPRAWWRKILTIPGAIAATALATFVAWAVTQLISSIQTKAAERHPISWVVESNPSQVGGFSSLPITLKLPAGRRPVTSPGPGCNGFTPWARHQGGVDAGMTRLAVVIRGRIDGQTNISNARAVITHRNKPITGTAVECPTAGEAQMRSLIINLDQPDTRAHYQSKTHRFGFTVEKGETETFLVTARAKRRTYTWYLDLTVIAGGKTRDIRVTDGGRPFRTTTPSRSQPWSWNFRDRWMGPKGQSVPVGVPLPASAGGAK
jgi:hypothetical protein